MALVSVSAEQQIAAPVEQVYRCIADYKEHHPKFLPAAFSNVVVEQGGAGAGTVVSYKMKAGPRERSYHMQVSEPDPGKILKETDTGSSLTTTYTVAPKDGGSLVTILTEWQGASGMGGFMERLFAPPALRKVYAEELGKLDKYVRNLNAATG